MTIGLELRNLSNCNINIYNGFQPLGNVEVRISNSSTFDNNDEDNVSVTEENQNIWIVKLQETEPETGNYAFTALPGKYYLEAYLPGFNKLYKTLSLVNGVNVFDFEMTPVLVGSLTFFTKNMFTGERVGNVKIKVYDTSGKLLADGDTNAEGEINLPLCFLKGYKLFTRKTGFIEVYQDFRLDSDTYHKEVGIPLIPATNQRESAFEVLISYNPDLFNYLFNMRLPSNQKLIIARIVNDLMIIRWRNCESKESLSNDI